MTMQMRLHTGSRIQQSLRAAFIHQAPSASASSAAASCRTPEMLLRRFLLSPAALTAGRAIQQRLRAIPRAFKSDSSKLLRMWAHQCECVLAQRVRRGQQMFQLYTRIWEEQALLAFAASVRRLLHRRAKELMLSAGVAYNWQRERICLDEMRSHLDEIEYIKLLRRKTIECTSCEKMDKNIIAFCECDTRKDLRTYDGWTVFIEQSDLVVWRRPHGAGSFEYKVYGNYKDVTAEDFLSVQMDTAYRKKWDPTAVELDVVERDAKEGTNSDIVYWEMQWPRLFANRDYVFKRRFLVDKELKRVMLVSKGTEHPKHPTKSNKFRVVDYWSVMVVKPYTEINTPGIEFSLTYFDNPGVNIPASVTAWVAYRAMPDFLTRLRAATIKYQQYCQVNKCRSIYSLLDDKDVKHTSNEGGELPTMPPVPEERWETGFDDSFYSVLNHELDADGTEEEQLKLNNNQQQPPPKKQDAQEARKAAAQDTRRSVAPDARQSTAPDARKSVAPDTRQSTAQDTRPTTSAKGTDTAGHPTVHASPSSASGAEVILAPSPIVQHPQADQSYWKYLQPTSYIS